MTKVKDLIKCKHPNSRKTNAIVKQIQKAKSRDKAKHTSNLKFNLLGEKLLWFRDNLEPNCSFYSSRQTLVIIEKYLSRFDGELEQIKIKRSIGNRKNRQHANREDAINLTIEAERGEFISCGLEIPDLLNIEQYSLLKGWTGELRFLPKFKLKRYSKNNLEKSSSDTESKREEESPKESSSVKHTSMDISISK